jgi:hypothetical protein
MIRLTDILKDVLTEAKPPKPKLHKGRKEGPIRPQTKEAIKNSIENRWLLNIYYEGDEETEPGYRWCEPYCWGLRIKTNNNILRAYQYRGKTLTEWGWKTFRLDRISSTAPLTSATFSKPRPKYNPNGDKHMTKIFMQVKFGGDDGETQGGPEAPIDIYSPEIKKTADIIQKNAEGDQVNFDELEKKPEFRDSKMKRALNVLRNLLSKAGKSIVKGLKNLHIKEEVDETN